MTPHTGELARLLERTPAEIDAHRLEAVRRAASRFGSVVVLKGADTLVASPREGVLAASYGRPSLATAGTGDVLSGVIAAFLAKGMEPRRAAAAAAVAHGLASRLVEPQAGLVASDLLPALQRALGGEGWEVDPLGSPAEALELEPRSGSSLGAAVGWRLAASWALQRRPLAAPPSSHREAPARASKAERRSRTG